MVYIALLRGINVSGHKLIPMAELRTLCAEIKLKNVRTYIQSGNIIFNSAEKSSESLEQKISAAILKKFGHQVVVKVITVPELAEILSKNPFLNFPDFNPVSMYFSLLMDTPHPENIQKLPANQKTGDQWHIINTIFYLYCPDGYGKTKLSNPFIEQKLKCVSTTRNWKTMYALLEMAQAE